MLRPRTATPVIIDYYRDTWYFQEPSPLEIARLQPTYVSSGRLVYALYCVDSLPDVWRGEAVCAFIDHLDEIENLERIPA